VFALLFQLNRNFAPGVRSPIHHTAAPTRSRVAVLVVELAAGRAVLQRSGRIGAVQLV
jgi:hypothetical protein